MRPENKAACQQAGTAFLVEHTGRQGDCLTYFGVSVTLYELNNPSIAFAAEDSAGRLRWR